MLNKFFYLLILSTISSHLYSQEAFITTWQTTTENETIIIPITGSDLNYFVEWGDGSSDTDLTNSPSHKYAAAGTYTVTIIGTFTSINFDHQSQKDKIKSVEQWGDVEWTFISFSFCSNLVINATDAPDLSKVDSMSNMFLGAISMNQDISHWDVSKVTDMSYMFSHSEAFNQDLSSWDVSQVTNMTGLFRGATEFNQPLDAWDVSKVKDMSYMFSQSDAFKQDLSSWDVSQVTDMSSMFYETVSFDQKLNSWDVSSVNNMLDMFHGAKAFNQPLNDWDVSRVTNMESMFDRASAFNQDISSWDVSQVTNMSKMFQGASVFNRDLSSWDVSQVVNMDGMLSNSGLDMNNYDATLSGWVTQALQDNISLGATGMTYCQSSEAREKLINDYGWSIDGDDSACVTDVANNGVSKVSGASLYPNPTFHQLHIELQEAPVAEVKTFNLLGVEVLSIIINKGIQGITLGTNHLKPGLYTLYLITDRQEPRVIKFTKAE